VRPITVSFGKADNLAAITIVREYNWQDFARALTAVPPETGDKAARGWYIPAAFKTGNRDSEQFTHRDCITFDFDHVEPGVYERVQDVLGGTAFAIYTTHSHTPETPRFRVLPLSRAAGYEEFEAITRKIAERIGIEHVARESFVPTQCMFMPACKVGKAGEFKTHINEGAWLDVAAVLSEYADWQDARTWPHRADGDTVYSGDGEPTPPDQKPGLIGRFCKAFRVPDAIRRFELPYTPTDNPRRWTYTAGSRAEGAIEYDDGLKFHSHHDTDPARGQHNAYDLVRLHKFGNDEASNSKMQDFVRSLPECQSKAEDEFTPQADVTASATPDKRLPKIRISKIRTDIRETVLAPPDFLWSPYIPRDGVTLLVGEDGLGKSWLALMIAMYAAAGKTLWDFPVQMGRTMYVHAEDRLPMLERRVQRIIQLFTPEEEARFHRNFEHYDVAADDVLLLTCRNGSPQPTPWVEAFEQQLGKRALCVFDPLARLHDGPENDSTMMTRCMKMLERIGVSTGGAVLAPHHPNKAGTQQHRVDGTDTRGSGAIRAASRSQLRLIAATRKNVPNATNISEDDLLEQNILILSQPKLSDGKKAKPRILKRASDGTIAPFSTACIDPMSALVVWFTDENGRKPFTRTAAVKARAHWGNMSEREAERFFDEQEAKGAFTPEGKVKSAISYVPSPATLERIAELAATSVHIISNEEWTNI